MTYRVRIAGGAQADLERLYNFIAQRDGGDSTLAACALDAIRNAIILLETSPFSCRKASAANAFLRELIIAFGVAGYVALFEIEDARTITILALRYQREDDYH